MTALQDFSNALADAVEHAGHYTVRVDARRRLPATGILWADNLVVTANHVVERNDNIHVGLPDGVTAPAELIGRDPGTDLAVLRVEELSGAASKADSAPRVGHFVLAIGRPTGGLRASSGIISAIGPSEPPKDEGRMHHRRRHRGGFGFAYAGENGGVMRDGAIHSDIVMYPGFSGGPLVDASGKLLGMNTSGIGHGSSLTIPLATIARIVEQLTTYGKIRRGFLGLSVQPMRLTEALADAVGQSTGLLIVATDPSGPADNAGLYQGDIVVSLDGQKTRTLDELLALLSGDRVGTTVPITIIRGGQAQTLNITVTERH